MRSLSVATIFSVFLALGLAVADYDLGFRDDSDLTHFITSASQRPEIKAPRLIIDTHDASRIEAGYWLVAPYASIIQADQPRRYYQACQTGPAIYDQSGELVWSGACQFKNQNVCDLRVFQANGTDHLSLILYGWNPDPKGSATILDESYQVTHQVNVSKELKNMNMHEFKVINDGKTGLHIIHRPEYIDVSELVEFGISDEAGWILNVGFREVEVNTGKILFEWWAYPHVSQSTSSVQIERLDGPWPMGWNYIHMNSVDKNEDGDYMVSARYTDTIYKVSGRDGSIIWQLGGDASSFEMLDGLNFSKQHDARFVQQNSTTTIISFLDNAADDSNSTAETSSALLVALETSSSPMTARVLQRWTRPDGQLSRLRGNVQLLPNSNVLVGWSDNAYMSEFTAEGELLLEARFASDRFVSYRSYKGNFTARPSEPPMVKSFAYGVSLATTTTVCYVSWNGATGVDVWRFYRNGTNTAIGTARRTGFETILQINGYEPAVYAEALSSTGEVLGRSLVASSIRPGEGGANVNIEKVYDVEEGNDVAFGIMSLASALQSVQAKMVGLVKA